MNYLRIKNEGFYFINDEENEIKETDIEITKEDFITFVKLQSEFKYFRLKKDPNVGVGLFDYIEEYTVTPVEAPKSELELLREKVAIQDGAIMELAEIISSLGVN